MSETVTPWWTEADVERVARAMCSAGGFDPHEAMANDGPRWRYYEPSATAALSAMPRPDDALREAQAEIARLREAVCYAEAVFDEYERLHHAKNTADGNAKAATNRGHAVKMRAALANGAAR